MASPLSEFTDYINMTPPVYMTSPEQMINDAIEQAPLLGHLLLGGEAASMIQGGSHIRDTILLDVTSTYQQHHPGEPVGGYVNRQSNTLHRVDWRFSRDHMTWTEEELNLNVPEGATRSQRRSVYKNLRFGKEQAMWTSIFNGIEGRLTANPHGTGASTVFYDAMEVGRGGREPYSIFAIINEIANGLPTGWTNVADINPATNTNWAPRQNTYDFDDPADEDGDADGLLDAMETNYLEVQFTPPKLSGTERFFQRSGRPNRQFIGASNGGVAFYKRLLLDRNDTLAGAQDPAYQFPKYAGTPVVQVSSFGTAAVYSPDGGPFTAAAVTELNATANGWRYYFIDPEFLKFFVHGSNFFKTQPAIRLQDQEDTHAQVTRVWWNMFPKSRLRLGIVYPQT